MLLIVYGYTHLLSKPDLSELHNCVKCLLIDAHTKAYVAITNPSKQPYKTPKKLTTPKNSVK